MCCALYIITYQDPMLTKHTSLLDVAACLYCNLLLLLLLLLLLFDCNQYIYILRIYLTIAFMYAVHYMLSMYQS